MLHLIPAPAHRAAFRLAHALRKLWWRVLRPNLSGCRVIARDSGGRVLLVRHSYGTGRWMLPGGGLKRGEDALVAAAREFAEETGCTLDGPRLLAVTSEPLFGAANVVHIVAGGCTGTPRADGREIVAAAFFDPAALPVDTANGLRDALPGWLTAAGAVLPPG